MDLSVKSNSLGSSNMLCNLSKVPFGKNKRKRNSSSNNEDNSFKEGSSSLISKNKSENISNQRLIVIPEESFNKGEDQNLIGGSHKFPRVNLDNEVLKQGDNTYKKIKHDKSIKKENTLADILQNTEVNIGHPDHVLNVESDLPFGQSKKKKRQDDIQENTVQKSKCWAQGGVNENSTDCDNTFQTKAKHKQRKKFNLCEIPNTKSESFLEESFNLSLDRKTLQDRLNEIENSDIQGTLKISESNSKQKKVKKRKNDNEEFYNKTDCGSCLLEGNKPQIKSTITPYNSTIYKDKTKSKSVGFNLKTETDHTNLTPSGSAPSNLSLYNDRVNREKLEHEVQNFKTKVKHKRKKKFNFCNALSKPLQNESFLVVNSNLYSGTESTQDRLNKIKISNNHDTLKHSKSNHKKKKFKKKLKTESEENSNKTDCVSFPLEGNKPQINTALTYNSTINKDKSKLPTDNFTSETDRKDLIPSDSATHSLSLPNSQEDKGELRHKIQTFNTKVKHKHKKKFNVCETPSIKDGSKQLHIGNNSNLCSETELLQERVNKIEKSDNHDTLKNSESNLKKKKSKKKLKAESEEFLNETDDGSFPLEGNKPQVDNALIKRNSTINKEKSNLPADNCMSKTDHNSLISSGIASSSLSLSNIQEDEGEFRHKIQTFKTKDGSKQLQNESCLGKNYNIYSGTEPLQDRVNKIEKSDNHDIIKYSESILNAKKSKKKLTTGNEFLNKTDCGSFLLQGNKPQISNIPTHCNSTINKEKTKLRSPADDFMAGTNNKELNFSGSPHSSLSLSDVSIKENKNKVADSKKMCKIKNNNKVDKVLSKDLNSDELKHKTKPSIRIKGRNEIDKLRYQILEKYMKSVKNNLNPDSVHKPVKTHKANLKVKKKAKSNDIDMIRQQLISKALKLASKSSEIKINASVNPAGKNLSEAKSTIAPENDNSNLLIKPKYVKIQHLNEEVSNTQKTLTAEQNLNPKSSGKHLSHGRAEVKDKKKQIEETVVDKAKVEKFQKHKTQKRLPLKKAVDIKTLSLEDMTSRLLSKALAKV